MITKQQKREYREQAQHLTYIDTLNHQKKLRTMIEELIKKRAILLPHKEMIS